MPSLAEQGMQIATDAISKSDGVGNAMQGYQFAQDTMKKRQDMEVQKEQVALAKTDHLFKSMEFGFSKVPKPARKGFFEGVVMPKAEALGIPIGKETIDMILKDDGLSNAAAKSFAEYINEKDPERKKQLAVQFAGMSQEPEKAITALTNVHKAEFDAEKWGAEFGFRKNESKTRDAKDSREQNQEFYKQKGELLKDATQAKMKYDEDLGRLKQARGAMETALKNNDAQAYNTGINALITAMQQRATDADFRIYEKQLGINGLVTDLQKWSGKVPISTAKNTIGMLDQILAQKSVGEDSLRQGFGERAKALSQGYNGLESPEQISRSFGFGTGSKAQSQAGGPKMLDKAILTQFATAAKRAIGNGATPQQVQMQFKAKVGRDPSPAELKAILGQ